MNVKKTSGKKPQERAERFVYSVLFLYAPESGKNYFLFSSLAAIYEMFSVEQIGCSLQHLYNLKVPAGITYNGKHTIIKRHKVRSKRHKTR